MAFKSQNKTRKLLEKRTFNHFHCFRVTLHLSWHLTLLRNFNCIYFMQIRIQSKRVQLQVTNDIFQFNCQLRSSHNALSSPISAIKLIASNNRDDISHTLNFGRRQLWEASPINCTSKRVYKYCFFICKSFFRTAAKSFRTDWLIHHRRSKTN